MSLYNYTRQRYNVLENASAPSNFGKCILASDFKTILVDLDQTGLDGELHIFVADQYEPVDVSLPFDKDTNEYYEVSYKDTRNGVLYSPAVPYNPSSSSPGGDAQFNVETTGTRWVIPCILNLAGGVVDKLSVNLYDNQ